MSFMLRIDDGRDFNLGSTFETLSAIGQLSELIAESEGDEFAEFLGLLATNEEEQSGEYLDKLRAQSVILRDRAGSSDAAWLADRIATMKPQEPFEGEWKQ
jgi:hypothetical protein